MSTRQAFRQLQHADAQQRKAAIKSLARAKDRNALRKLALLSGDDPDPEVRQLARRAGIYIRQEIGDLPKPAPEQQSNDNKGGKADKIEVDEKNQQRAQKALEAAMTALTREERAGMIKHLRKALSYDPNLRTDAYFQSLCETATGEQAAKAIEMITDDTLYATISEKESQEKTEQALSEHYEKVAVVNWSGVAFDLSVFFLITLLGTILTTFILLQSAQGFMSRYDAAVEAWINNEVDEDGEPVELPVVEAGFQEFSELMSSVSLSRVFVNGLFAAFSAVISLMISCVAIHMMSKMLFKGEGKFPYLLHRWANLFSTRTVAIYLLLFVGISVIFSLGGGFIVFIVLGLVGIIALLTFFKSISIIAEAYHFGWVKGFVAFVVGMVLVGILNTVLTLATGINFV